MENKINVQIDGNEIIYRTGQAAKIIEPKAIQISGVINTPLEFLKVRKDKVDLLCSNLQVDREGLQLVLVTNENTELANTITGQLSLTKEFNSFGINTGKGWVARELAEHIKMNRSCFESKDVANKMVSVLMDVKIRVDKAVENQSGNRGNIRQLKEQVLTECSIPESITLDLPIFKGTKKTTFLCETWINPDDLTVKLISPDAADFIRSVRDEEMDNVISQIREICPELAIIEI
jgi:hypothetical protein